MNEQTLFLDTCQTQISLLLINLLFCSKAYLATTYFMKELVAQVPHSGLKLRAGTTTGRKEHKMYEALSW